MLHSQEAALKSPVAIRYFALSPEGELLRLSLVFVQWVHHRPKRVWAQSFAGRTMRLVECVLQMDDGKAVGIQQMGFSLIRFDGAGQPDRRTGFAKFGSSTSRRDPVVLRILGQLLQPGRYLVRDGAK